MATDVVNVAEYEILAKEKMPKMAFDFFSTGAEDLWTLRENILAFQRIRLRPRILLDVSHVDMSTEVLGFKISMPIMVAPTALHKLAHPAGEVATAKATSAANTIMVLSSSASTTLEEVQNTASGVRFFQLYVYKNREVTARVVRRAEKAGYKAIVLTVDAPTIGRREADIRNRFTLPPGLTYSNFEELIDPGLLATQGSGSVLNNFASTQLDSTLSWESIRWLKTITSLPILIKGVLTAEDARLGVQHGVAGIIVSNHGGRQLDYSPATIDVLEEVVHVVANKVPVFMDGGIRRGSDVFKALALGAAGVFIGRPVVFGLAVGGEAGVSKVLKMLRDEFESVMTLAGCVNVNNITRAHVVKLKDVSHLSRF